MPTLAQLEAPDLRRLDIVDAGRLGQVGPKSFERLAQVLDSLTHALGERRGLDERDELRQAVLAERGERGGDGALVAHGECGLDEHGRVVTIEPVPVARHGGRAEVVEGDRPVRVHDAPVRVQVSMADPGGVQIVHRGPGGSEDIVGDLLDRHVGERGARRRFGHQDRGVGAAHTAVHEARGGHACPFGEHEREADVLDVLEARAEDRESGLAVHQVMPDLRRHLGVALVTTERGDAHMVTGIELDVHH